METSQWIAVSLQACQGQLGDCRRRARRKEQWGEAERASWRQRHWGRQGAGGAKAPSLKAPSLTRPQTIPDRSLSACTEGGWTSRPSSHELTPFMARTEGREGRCPAPEAFLLPFPTFPPSGTLHSYVKATLEEKLIKYQLKFCAR